MVVAELVTSLNGPRSFPEPDSAARLGFNPQIQTHLATYLYMYTRPPPSLPHARVPTPDPILTKPVGIVPTDPARPGAPDHTEDLAGGDSGLNLSRVKAETVVKADVHSQFRSDSFPNAQWKTRSFP